jgi:putative Mg2+ transporter-C (MgtC) family protein
VYWLEYLRELNTISIIFRLLLATLFGGIIGIERGSKRRAAGFRTYMLVCIGSALVMITGQYITALSPTSDPSRMGAQVISGIGFLGAGTIIMTSHQVKGLTTAAGLWASACFGLAIGVGFYEGAVIASVLIFLVLTVLHKLESAMLSSSTRIIDVYLEFAEGGKISSLIEFAERNAIRVRNVEFATPPLGAQGQSAALISMLLPKRHPHSEVLAEFMKVEGIQHISEM